MVGTEYRKLAALLGKQGSFKPLWSYGAATVLVELGVFGLAAIALTRVPALSIEFFLLEAFCGLSIFRFFVIVHECGHRTLFPSRLVCTIAGTIASMFCMIPFAPWRHVHMLHHKWVGVLDKDPTQEALLQLRNYGAGMNFLFRLVWKLWLPVMFLVFIFRVFWTHPFKELARGNRKLAMQGFVSLAAVLAPRIALVAVFGWKTTLLYLGPMTFAFLFIDENVSLPQHTGHFPFLSDRHPAPIPFHEQDAVTRTTAGASIFSVVGALNFNLHTEHHLFPSVPWYWLPRVTRQVEQLDSYERVNFAKYMLSIRMQDPVNVYTRALPPVTAFPGNDESHAAAE